MRPVLAMLAACLLLPQAGWAEIRIGGIISITGPTAAQGSGYRNAFDLLPTEMGGEHVTYVIRDDGGDPAQAVTVARKLITEDHVDAILGPAITASIASVLPVANEAKVPMIVMSPFTIDPAATPYAFVDAQPVGLMMQGVIDHMKAHGQATAGFIGFSDGWGDVVWKALSADAAGSGIKLLDDERFARTDSSVQPQVLKVMSQHPDAVVLGGSATPGALPNIALTQRGYKGQVYNNHGVVGEQYIRVGGAAVEGCIAPTGPLVVYDQLPASNPVKPVATAFMEKYLAKFGPQSRNPFAGYTYDAGLLVQAAVPEALKAGKPGTEAFREGLRAGLEHVHGLVGTHGVYDMSATDHNGMDARARVMVQVQHGAWTLIQ